MAQNEESVYDVGALVNFKIEDNHEYVLVQWKGWPDPNDNTWEKVEDLDAESFAVEIENLRARFREENAAKVLSGARDGDPKSAAATIDPPPKRKRGRPPKVKPTVVNTVAAPEAVAKEISQESSTPPVHESDPVVMIEESNDSPLPPVAETAAPEQSPPEPKHPTLAALAKQGMMKRKIARKAVFEPKFASGPATGAPPSSASETTAAINSSNSSSGVTGGVGEDVTKTSTTNKMIEKPDAASPKDLTDLPSDKSSASTAHTLEADSRPSRNLGANNDNSLDSPLLDASEAEPEVCPTKPTSSSMLLPMTWPAAGPNIDASKSTEKTTEEKRLIGSTPATTKPTEPATPKTPQGNTPPVSRTMPKRRAEGSASAVPKKRARRRAARDEDFSESDDEPLSTGVTTRGGAATPSGAMNTAATTRRRPGGQTGRRFEKKDNIVEAENNMRGAAVGSPELSGDAAAAATPSTGHTEMSTKIFNEIDHQYRYANAYIPMPVTLLSPELIRSIIREELDRNRHLIESEKRVVIRRIGSPPPGSSKESPQWGLVEDCETGTQMYLPIEDIRSRFSQPLVDYLIKDGRTKTTVLPPS